MLLLNGISMLFWRFLLLLVYVQSCPDDDISVRGTSDHIQSIIFMLILDKNHVHGKMYAIKGLFQTFE